MSILNSVIDAAPLYQKQNPLDNYIAITDPEGVIVLFLQAQTFTMNVKVGDQVASQGAVADCTRTRQEVRKTLPKEIYGRVVKVISTPIFDGSNFVGVLTSGISFETQEKLHGAAENIAATAEQLTAAMEEIAAHSSQLAKEVDRTKNSSERVLDEVKKTDEILGFVSDVAANSNLLGLNAAIEAARAGEQGRGFAVVADEIRKMAINSEKAVKDIKKLLQNIQKENEEMVNAIAQTAQLSERQAATTQEISASMQQLSALAMEIERIAEIV
ncbi:MAG: yfmS 10 [Firmicutes bacterium]|nr:yfmS 10 [Bacillota bacterium]